MSGKREIGICSVSAMPEMTRIDTVKRIALT
jgi:hypothetical protein